MHVSVRKITWKLLQIPDFCLVITQTGEKYPMSLHVKITGQAQGHFLEVSRSLSKVMSYSLVASTYNIFSFKTTNLRQALVFLSNKKCY